MLYYFNIGMNLYIMDIMNNNSIYYLAGFHINFLSIFKLINCFKKNF